MKAFWCWLLGHKPTGPYWRRFDGHPDLDSHVFVCARCGDALRRHRDGGWRP